MTKELKKDIEFWFALLGIVCILCGFSYWIGVFRSDDDKYEYYRNGYEDGHSSVDNPTTTIEAIYISTKLSDFLQEKLRITLWTEYDKVTGEKKEYYTDDLDKYEYNENLCFRLDDYHYLMSPKGFAQCTQLKKKLGL